MTSTYATPRVRYQHRQTGWVLLGLAALPSTCLIVLWLLAPPAQRQLPGPLLPGVAVITAVALLGFSSLSVRVTRDALVARFGIGLVRRTVALADIVAVEVARTRWYEGWGIHRTARGMLYNVAGFDAVRLRLADGRSVTIGSDDAARLAATVRRAIDDRRAGR